MGLPDHMKPPLWGFYLYICSTTLWFYCLVYPTFLFIYFCPVTATVVFHRKNLASGGPLGVKIIIRMFWLLMVLPLWRRHERNTLHKLFLPEFFLLSSVRLHQSRPVRCLTEGCPALQWEGWSQIFFFCLWYVLCLKFKLCMNWMLL